MKREDSSSLNWIFQRPIHDLNINNIGNLCNMSKVTWYIYVALPPSEFVENYLVEGRDLGLEGESWGFGCLV